VRWLKRATAVAAVACKILENTRKHSMCINTENLPDHFSLLPAAESALPAGEPSPTDALPSPLSLGKHPPDTNEYNTR